MIHWAYPRRQSKRLRAVKHVAFRIIIQLTKRDAQNDRRGSLVNQIENRSVKPRRPTTGLGMSRGFTLEPRFSHTNTKATLEDEI